MSASASAIVLLSFWIVQIVAVISPGPSLLVVARSSMAISRQAGYFNALGFAVGSAMWAVTAVLGLNVIFSIFPWIYVAVKVLGGLYLLYLASKMFRSPSFEIGSESAPRMYEAARTSFMKGLIVQISNPKVVIFMGSIMTSILPSSPPFSLMAAAVCIVFFNELAWYSFVAYAFSIDRVRRGYARTSRGIDRAAGLFIGGLGLRLLVSS